MMHNPPAPGTDGPWSRDAAARRDGRCHGCALRGSQLCHSIRSGALSGWRAPVIRRFARGKSIVEQGETSGFLGVIRQGFARWSTMRVNGERVLLDFAVPGDIVGGLPGHEQSFDFEAATDIEICLYDMGTIKRQMEVNREFRGLIQKEMENRHRRLLDLVWRNGTLNSRERIMAFLVRSVAVMPTETLSDGSLILTMEIDRRDWADLTNTAVETISRTLRYLEEKNLVISLSPYRFRIRNLDLLATLAGTDSPVERRPARRLA